MAAKKRTTKTATVKKSVQKKAAKTKQRPSRPSLTATQRIKQQKKALCKRTGADSVIGDCTEDTTVKNAAIDISSLKPESINPNYAPGSLSIEENENLLKLEHQAQVRIDGKKYRTKMDDQTREYLGQLVWYWRTRGFNYTKIADRYNLSLGLLHRVYEEYLSSIRQYMEDTRENHIAMELARIDDLMFQFLPYCKKHEVEQVFTRRYNDKMLVKKVVVESPPSVEYATFVLKLMERRAKLLGLDAPAKSDLGDVINNFVVYGPPKSENVDQWANETDIESVNSLSDEKKKDNDIQRH